MLLEWLLIGAVAALGLWAVVGPGGRSSILALLLMMMVGVASVLGVSSAASSPAPRPIAEGRRGFVSSNACRSCHPAEHASWHRSFHRSMTQAAKLENVAAPELRNGRRLRVETGGRTVELFAKGDQLWARLPDPDLTSARPETYENVFKAAPIRDVQVQLLTGSHHHQAFWVRAARSGELRAVPVVYSIDEGRALPRRDAFLNPPDAPEQAVRWNSNCVQCHAVAGAPAHDEARDVFETSVAELGIACEACHGAGAEHVRAMQNPLRRYQARAAESAPHIINPARLDAERASQVCGRCHSYFFPKQEADWWQNGFAESYTPGGDLSKAQLLLSPELLAAPGAPNVAADVDSLFYRDGTIRIGGREYNGLVRSPCYERGHGERKLSCMSCHSLHRGAADDQLDPEKLGNAACGSCHAAQAKDVSAHTHHRPDSAGSLCYNCHMPHTSYALLGAIRSHRVSSPSFDASARDRPNACNLCHLKRSEYWAAEETVAWFGRKPRLTFERGAWPVNLPAGAKYALTGDAAVRAITAAALGRDQSPERDSELRSELLQELARDEYAAVRNIAERSARGLSLPLHRPDSWLIEDGPSTSQFARLRDRRPITLAE